MISVKKCEATSVLFHSVFVVIASLGEEKLLFLRIFDCVADTLLFFSLLFFVHFRRN